MNLHGFVSGAISAVNPLVTVTIQLSTGGTINDDGKPVAGYADRIEVQAQVQALSQADIQHADSLNIQGVRRALYISGEVDGLVRSKNKGGDLVTLPEGSVWLVSDISEHWPDWTKAIITLQDDPPPS